MCHNVIPEDDYKCTVSRSLVLPRHPDENAPRQILTHASDYLQLTRDMRLKLGIDAGPEALQESRIIGSTTRRRREVKPAPQRTASGGKKKKSNSPNKRSSSPMGTFKYGVYVPKNTKEALELDRRNGNTLWQDAIHKELGAIMSMKTFKVLSQQEKSKFNRKDSSFAPVRCIYDVKV